MRVVAMKNIRQNGPSHPRLRPHVLYADLHDAVTDELLVSATLEYCANAIRDRGYTLESISGDVRQNGALLAHQMKDRRAR